MLIRDRRVRAFARNVPGLAAAGRTLTRWFLLRRGVGRLDYGGARLRIRTTSSETIKLRLRPLAKEPWTVAWIEENLRDGDVLYDVGANVGDYALIAGAYQPKARVVAIEPGAANFASLCDNVQLNELDDRVIPLPVVLGESSRLGALSYGDTQPGAAIHVLDGKGGAYDQPVLVFALDDLLDRFALPAPTLIKLDVDGAEAAVLAGAQRTLADPRLRSLLIEVENERTDEVLERVAASGLELRRRVDERYGEPLPGVWYGIFERAA